MCVVRDQETEGQLKERLVEMCRSCAFDATVLMERVDGVSKGGGRVSRATSSDRKTVLSSSFLKCAAVAYSAQRRRKIGLKMCNSYTSSATTRKKRGL